jgi:hypothetical protein
MDGFREHPSDFELPASSEVSAPADVASAIGTDERRMHVRAYNHWVSLLDGRDFPSIEDLEPAEVEDFAGHSVLLDFTCGRDNPAVPYIGAEIRDECGLTDDTRSIADVPSRSLLSRLTDHYMQIIANRAPIGFEAEFVNQREENICYRGILMPFSSDGDTIDFIYGVINWKTVGADDTELQDEAAVQAELPALEVEAAAVDELLLDEAAFAEPSEEPVGVGPFEVAEAVIASECEQEEQEEPIAEQPSDATDAAAFGAYEPPALAEVAPEPVHFEWEDSISADAEADEVPEVTLDEDAGLADRLWVARETAESVKAGEGRTRAALYKALSLAYDFALATQQNPEDYAELLEESGVKAQARAPMTPIVKLVFGVDYDKARLTEFAAALSYAQRQDLAAGAFQDFIEKQAGGLKALVAAERQARRPESAPDTKGEAARAKLRTAPSISLADLPASDEFAVVVTRRRPDGSHEAVALVEDEALVERAIRRAA